MGLINKTKAATLPEGWIWIDCEDGSGSLDNPNGKAVFSYDKNERTYDGGLSCTTADGGGYSFLGDLDAFKAYAESVVNETLKRTAKDADVPVEKEVRKRYTEVSGDGMRAMLKHVENCNVLHPFGEYYVVYGEAIDKFKALEDAEEEFSKKIDTLLASYRGNKEELADIEEHLNNHGCLDNGLSEASESFEQGYNNALEYVFNVLGIKY